jgi:hypothetical protein
MPDTSSPQIGQHGFTKIIMSHPPKSTWEHAIGIENGG